MLLDLHHLITMLAISEGFKYEGLTTEYKLRERKTDSDDDDDVEDEFDRTKLKLKPSLYRAHFFNEGKDMPFL